VQALAEALPVRDATFDAVLLVAVLGTMPRQADRVAALREARRALRPGGAMLVTAWARWQPKYVRALLGLGPWRRTGPGRVLAPWAQGSQRVERPYFLYTSRGLRADLGAAGWTGGRVRKVALAGKGPDNLVVEATAPRAPSNPS
jgi:SAM-dependent methyltransferase